MDDQVIKAFVIAVFIMGHYAVVIGTWIWITKRGERQWNE